MLWFSIPMVVLLAAIPLLVIVSQIEDFSMLRKYWTFENIFMLLQFTFACIQAFNKPFGFGFWFNSILAIWTIWLMTKNEAL